MVSDAMQCQVRERHEFALRCKSWRVNCRHFHLFFKSFLFSSYSYIKMITLRNKGT